jgi:hypothetical protein
MAPYLFPYPTTGPVTFSNVLLDRAAAYTTQLADATVARTRLQVALAAAANGEAGASALSVLEVSSGTSASTSAANRPLTAGGAGIPPAPAGDHALSRHGRPALQGRPR